MAAVSIALVIWESVTVMMTVDGQDYEVQLLDDGTLDTVIEVDGIEHRYDGEFAAHWRDETGALSEEGLKELAANAIENDERHWGEE